MAARQCKTGRGNRQATRPAPTRPTRPAHPRPGRVTVAGVPIPPGLPAASPAVKLTGDGRRVTEFPQGHSPSSPNKNPCSARVSVLSGSFAIYRYSYKVGPHASKQTRGSNPLRCNIIRPPLIGVKSVVVQRNSVLANPREGAIQSGCFFLFRGDEPRPTALTRLPTRRLCRAEPFPDGVDTAAGQACYWVTTKICTVPCGYMLG